MNVYEKPEHKRWFIQKTIQKTELCEKKWLYWGYVIFDVSSVRKKIRKFYSIMNFVA